LDGTLRGVYRVASRVNGMGNLSIYLSPLVFSAILGFALTLFIFRSRQAPGARALLILILGATLWSISYAMELLSPTLALKIFWAKFQYFGIISIPLAWYIFSIQHLGASSSSERALSYHSLLWVMPILTLYLVWTNESHHLIWQNATLQSLGDFQILELDHGVWFWIYWIFSYALLLAGTIKIISGLYSTVRYQRWQVWMMLFASIFPWVGNLVYVLDLNPMPGLDWTPFTFIIAGLVFTFSHFRFRLLNILPIARQTVFAGQSDGLFVLDLDGRIVDLNAAAIEIFNFSGETVIGQPYFLTLPELQKWIEQSGNQPEFRVEISLKPDSGERFYDLRITPLKGPYRFLIGRLLVLHDITQHKVEHSRLEQARMQLEEIVNDRTETLRLTIDQLQHELEQRSMAEKRFEEVVESAPDAMLLLDQAGTIILINAQAENLFGYSRKELVGQNIRILASEDRREENYSAFLRYVNNPSTIQIDTGRNLQVTKKDGCQIPIEISLGPLRIENGYWVACNVRDISERIKNEQEQKQLLEELSQSREQLQALTFRLHQVRENERRMIATELHDGVGQNLTGLNLNLQLIENELRTYPCAQDVQTRLEDSVRLVEATTRQVRDVMTYLHPPVLDEYGLVAAMQWYGNSFSQRVGFHIQVVGEEFSPRLSQNVEIVIFRIVQEALNNVAKHAKASQVTINVESSDEPARIVVEDNGIGFDPTTINNREDEPHWGIINMQQRAASIQGTVEIDSTPNWGTRVVISVGR
jgi:PAS domain S-box-containing protein